MAGALAVDFKGVDQVYSGVGSGNSDSGDRSNKEALISYLLSRGVDVNTRNNECDSPFNILCSSNLPYSVMEFIQQKGYYFMGHQVAVKLLWGLL